MDRSVSRTNAEDIASQAEAIPLVVDLDGTLVRSDLLYESFFNAVATNPRATIEALPALTAGKAALKRGLAELSNIDYATLPYNQRVLDLIAKARAEGRPIVLATASDRRHADGIAEHLQVFDQVLASDGSLNLSAGNKAAALVQTFGDGKFDYVGNDAADIDVWAHAHRAWTVDATDNVFANIRTKGGEIAVLEPRTRAIRPWLKAVRVPQYAKNALIFVPLLTSHTFTWHAILQTCVAFIAFCLCASSVYLFNDLLDLRSDRTHATKRRRPIANGSVRISEAVAVTPVLLIVALILAALVRWQLLATLAAYFVMTCSYSLYLKRRLLIDVVTLAMLYTVRIFAGASAIGVDVSHWLLAFSLFLFMSLALMKRYVELTSRLDRGLSDPSDRNYRLSDLDIVAALAGATGVNAVMVLSLYVAAPEIQANYARPEALWLMCPILLYWIGRALMMAHRRDMNDDPVVFALTDRNSRIAVLCIIVIFLIASFG